MSKTKRILLGVAFGLVALQVFRPTRNVSVTAPTPDDFVAKFSPPPTVASALRTACYDCHSNRTRYPWYANVQPIGWWLAEHVQDAKHALNLSEFGAYATKQQARKLSLMSDQISHGDMPLRSYTWLHRDARLTPRQIDELTSWLDDLHDRVETAE